MRFGGGLDVRITRRFSFRTLAMYSQAFVGSNALPRQRVDALGWSSGLPFHRNLHVPAGVNPRVWASLLESFGNDGLCADEPVQSEDADSSRPIRMFDAVGEGVQEIAQALK
jgi:hypothetical protein